MKLALSTGSVFDNTTLHWAPWMQIGEFGSLAARAGYDGLEVTPFRFVPSLQILKENITPSVASRILSAHQSFRSERWFWEWLRHESPLLALFTYLALPYKPRSIRHLEILQKITSEEIPVILYEDAVTTADLGTKKLIQPAPRLLIDWNITDALNFPRVALSRGYDGLCLDLNHIVATHKGRGFGDWLEAFHIFLPYTQEIHVRATSPAEHFILGIANPAQDLNRFLVDIGPESILTNMLEAIRRFKWDGLVVVELPLSLLKNVLNMPGPSTRREDVVFMHQIITERVRVIFDL